MKAKYGLFLLLFTMVASTGWSQGLTYVSGKTEKGVVKDLTPDGVIFMRMMKGQFDATDDAFTAKSVQFSIQKVPYENVKAINNVPIAAYKVLYSSNPIYRLVERMKYQWITSMEGGNFVKQAESFFLFLMLLGVLVPLLVWLGAKLTGARMGFMTGVFMSVVIYAIGYGLMKAFESMTIDGVSFMQSSGGQMGITLGAMLVVGVLIGIMSKENVLSGLAMIVGWFAGIYAAMWVITMV